MPADPSLSVKRGLPALIERAGVAPSEIELVVHGTTLALNAIIQRRGAKLGLVVSRGNRRVGDRSRAAAKCIQFSAAEGADPGAAQPCAGGLGAARSPRRHCGRGDGCRTGRDCQHARRGQGRCDHGHAAARLCATGIRSRNRHIVASPAARPCHHAIGRDLARAARIRALPGGTDERLCRADDDQLPGQAEPAHPSPRHQRPRLHNQQQRRHAQH